MRTETIWWRWPVRNPPARRRDRVRARPCSSDVSTPLSRFPVAQRSGAATLGLVRSRREDVMAPSGPMPRKSRPADVRGVPKSVANEAVGGPPGSHRRDPAHRARQSSSGHAGVHRPDACTVTELSTAGAAIGSSCPGGDVGRCTSRRAEWFDGEILPTRTHLPREAAYRHGRLPGPRPPLMGRRSAHHKAGPWYKDCGSSPRPGTGQCDAKVAAPGGAGKKKGKRP